VHGPAFSSDLEMLLACGGKIIFKLSICLSTDQAVPPDDTGMQGFRDITRRYSRQGEHLIPFFDSSCMCSYIHVSRHVHEGFDGLNWIN